MVLMTRLRSLDLNLLSFQMTRTGLHRLTETEHGVTLYERYETFVPGVCHRHLPIDFSFREGKKLLLETNPARNRRLPLQTISDSRKQNREVGYPPKENLAIMKILGILR